MKITIKGNEVALRYTIKGLILFETVKSQVHPRRNLFDTITLIWCFVRTELERAGSDYNLTLEQFIDWIDEEPKAYKRCLEWLSAEQARQTELLGDGDDDEKKSLPQP